MNLVVGNRDRFSHAIRGRAGFPLQPRPQHRQRHVGGFAAGRLAADAVDEDEEAARDVDVEPILVDLALEARVGVARRRQRADRLHGDYSCARPGARPTRQPATSAASAASKRETGPEEERHQSAFRKSRNTVSARPIRAVSGSGVSTPFSRFAPSCSS